MDIFICNGCKKEIPLADKIPGKRKCQNCINLRARNWYKRTIEVRRQKAKELYHNRTDDQVSKRALAVKKCSRKRYIKNREQILINEKRKRIEIRFEIIQEYGGCCKCCGETEPGFLVIDHIYNDGGKERKEIGKGCHFYFWLKRKGFPKDRYRLLCHNCNMSRAFFGACPHEQKTLGEGCKNEAA